MTHQTLVALAIAGHTLTTLSAVAGAVFLAYHGRAGWGWLILLAVCLGSYSVVKSHA